MKCLTRTIHFYFRCYKEKLQICIAAPKTSQWRISRQSQPLCYNHLPHELSGEPDVATRNCSLSHNTLHCIHKKIEKYHPILFSNPHLFIHTHTTLIFHISIFLQSYIFILATYTDKQKTNINRENPKAVGIIINYSVLT